MSPVELKFTGTEERIKRAQSDLGEQVLQLGKVRQVFIRFSLFLY
jgi:hypothetical protein